MEELYTGRIAWFSAIKGYGFISWKKDNVEQKDMFVHYSGIAVEGFKTLNKDDKVSFKIGYNKNGDPKAIDVTLVS